MTIHIPPAAPFPRAYGGGEPRQLLASGLAETFQRSDSNSAFHHFMQLVPILLMGRKERRASGLAVPALIWAR
jgi:hypothetical protein